jgi:hypothetical protein
MPAMLEKNNTEFAGSFTFQFAFKGENRICEYAYGFFDENSDSSW